MKKLTAFLAVTFLLFSASAFTYADVNVSKKIKSSFEKDFTSYSDVTWIKNEDLYVASFKAKEQNFAAAYNEEGDLLSVSRKITLAQLPLSVSLALQKKYPGYTFSDSVIELFADGTTYFVNAENEKFKVNIQSDPTGNFTVIKTKRSKQW
jgi:hypothetical protein